jgi:hypothetical protein
LTEAPNIYGFAGGPKYQGVTPDQDFQAALNLPLNLSTNIAEQFRGNVKATYGLGTAVDQFTIPEGRPTDANSFAEMARGLVGTTAPLYGIYEGARRFSQSFLDQGTALDEAAYKSSQWYRESIPWDASMTDTRAAALAVEDDLRSVREFYAEKRPISSFIAGFAGQMMDPINFIPVVSPAMRAAQIAKFGGFAGRVAAGSLDAAANTAAAALLTRQERSRYGEDVSWQTTVSEVAMAAGIGGAFGAVGGAWAAFKGKRSAKNLELEEAKLKTTMEMRKGLNEALEAASRAEDLNLSPNAADPIRAMAARLDGPTKLRTEFGSRMRSQFETAGLPKEQALQSAKVFESVIETFATRYNMTVDALVDRVGGLEIRAGRAAAATPEPAQAMAQAAATQTPEFRVWFGNSKVVGADGRPKVMYHGHDEAFSAFDKTRIRANDYDAPFNGFWFSDNPDTGPAMRDARAVMPVYVSVRNPAPADAWRRVARAVREDRNIRPGARSEGDETRARLQDEGYDGVQFDGAPNVDRAAYERDGRVTFNTVRGSPYTLINEGDMGANLYRGSGDNLDHITGYMDFDDFQRTFDAETVWVAFEPAQIKSINNRGTFDPNDPNILNQEGVPLFGENAAIKAKIIPTGKGGMIKIEDVGRALHEDHMEKHGRQLFPENSPEDFDAVVEMAIADTENQLPRPNSGVGWYSKDTELAVDLTAQIFPTLKTDPNHRKLYLTFAGLFSNGSTPEDAWRISADAFRYFIGTGEIPTLRRNPDGSPVEMTTFKSNKTGEMVTQPKGWGVRNASNVQQLELIKYLVDTKGLGPAMDWLLTRHPRTEINAAMKDSGVYKDGRWTTKDEIAGPDDWGALVLGDKLGRYTLGVHGLEVGSADATVDVWYVRSYRRWTGRLFETPIDPKSGIVGRPTDVDRSVIFKITQAVMDRFGLSTGDAQAVLWFFEKRLFGDMGVRTSDGTNSSGARKLLAANGVHIGEGGVGEGDPSIAGVGPLFHSPVQGGGHEAPRL